MIKDSLVLFDLDGTLIDSHEAIYYSAISVLSQFSKSLPTKKEVFKSVGLPIRDLFSDFIDEALLDIAVPEFRNHLREFGADKTNLLPNAVRTLEKFKSEYVTLGIVSNKQTTLAKNVLKQQNIDEYFDIVIGSDLEHRNPRPKCLICYALSFLKRKFL